MQENNSFIASYNLTIQIVKVWIIGNKLLYEIQWTDMQMQADKQKDR